MLHIAQLGLRLNEGLDRLDRSFDGSRELVHVLWLDNSLQVILEDFGKIVCSPSLVCRL